MAFDFKKEYREFYLPGGQPEIVTIPPMKYLAVRGEGDPNEEGGAYKAAIGLLYAIAFTIKMSKLTDHRIDGYFDYVVPPLEGFAAAGRKRLRLREQGGLPLDFRYSPAGLRDEGRFRLGNRRGDAEERAGFLRRRIPDDRRMSLRAADARRPV